MPFTLSHPAAVVPIYRWSAKRLPLSALVIGSISPDFAYFFRGISSYFSHSLLGVLLFCLPAGLVAYCLFHLLMKRPTSLLLPESIASPVRVLAFSQPLLPQFAVWRVSLAIIIGACTHVAWDSCIHSDTWLVSHVTWMRFNVGNIAGYSFPVYRIFKHASTILGLSALFWWFFAWLRIQTAKADTESSGLFPLRHRVLITACIFLASAIWGLLAAIATWGAYYEFWLFRVAIACMRAFFVTLAIYCLGWQLFANFSRHKS